MLYRRRTLHFEWKPRRRPAWRPAADRPSPQRIGQGGDAVVSRPDAAGAARAAAGRLSGRAIPRLHDAGSGPAAASGGRRGRHRLALRAGGQTDERGDQRHARGSGASLDIAGAGRARAHVAVDLRPEIQGDGRGVADGISDALADAAGGGQAGEFPRSRFRRRPHARLRIRKRLQHRLQEGHGLFAAAV